MMVIFKTDDSQYFRILYYQVRIYYYNTVKILSMIFSFDQHTEVPTQISGQGVAIGSMMDFL